MRVGIVTSWFERGAAYVSRQFMEVLQKTDDVFIYARGGEKYAKEDPKWNLHNVYWGKRTKFVTYYASYIVKRDFVKWLKKQEIEVVLFNEQHYFSPVLWCKELGIKTVAYIDYYKEDTIPLFDVYDCLICNTKRHYFAFKHHKNAQYIKWGTDINIFRPQDIPHPKLTFFHSAGMGPKRKGTDIVIKSFYNTKNRKNSLLLIHTQVSLEKSFPELATLITELTNEGSLEIVEKTISAPGLYYRGDVYVYPSRLDGLGLTLMEAIASGMACITVDNGPMNEFVEPSFGSLIDIEYFYSRCDGYYWPIGIANIEHLSKILDDYIKDQNNLSNKKKAAREYAERELDFYKNCSSLHDLIGKTTCESVSIDMKSRILSYDRILINRIMFLFYNVYQSTKKLL